MRRTVHSDIKEYVNILRDILGAQLLLQMHVCVCECLLGRMYKVFVQQRQYRRLIPKKIKIIIYLLYCEAVWCCVALCGIKMEKHAKKENTFNGKRFVAKYFFIGDVLPSQGSCYLFEHISLKLHFVYDLFQRMQIHIEQRIIRSHCSPFISIHYFRPYM